MNVASQQLWHYAGGNPPMSATHLFEDNLDVIERSIAQVCRHVRLHGADAEDFASCARLALLADDCAILSKFEGRSSLGSYVAIVVRRLFISQKRAEGRWHPSAEAMRHGEAAMTLDRLLHYEGRSFAEALALTKVRHPDADVHELETIAEALPHRQPRLRLVPVMEGDEDRFAGSAAADERVVAADLDKRSDRTGRAVQEAFATMTAQDRVVLRLRFAKSMSIADIARALSIEQRPLYRRIEALLTDLRNALQRAGIDGAEAADLIAAAGDRLNFGPAFGKTSDSQPSDQAEST
jgi:RNA polymerase sigma factor (sigma-70 family)